MNQSAVIFPAAPQCAPSREIDELPLPYVEIDAHGIITRANRATLALHHPGQGDLIGKCGWDLMAVDEKDRSSAAFLSLMESGEDPPVITRSIFDRSGSFRTYEFHRSLMRDAMGKPAGMRMVAVDVTETARALEDTHRRNQWLESVMDSLHEAIIATDATGVIAGMNPAAEELLSWKAAELVGKTLEEGLQFRSFQTGNNAHATFVTGLTSQCNGLSTLVDRHGQEIVVRVWSSPVVDKKTGSVAGIVLVIYKPGDAFRVPG